MNKAEYKKLSHDIRTDNRKYRDILTERDGRHHTTRGTMHNVLLWCDTTAIDKYGNNLYRYCCIGDYDTGLVWSKRF